MYAVGVGAGGRAYFGAGTTLAVYDANTAMWSTAVFPTASPFNLVGVGLSLFDIAGKIVGARLTSGNGSYGGGFSVAVYDPDANAWSPEVVVVCVNDTRILCGNAA